MSSIADLRKEYQLQSLSEKNVDTNPLHQFEKWWDEAILAKIEEANAMTLATASSDGIPSARIVLLKGFNERGFIFFTNYNSYKAQQVTENPRACLVFFWKELERQIRITGLVEKISDTANDEYFLGRPLASRVGAWASPQSQVIENREWLEANHHYFEQQFEGKFVSRPQHWGGYLVKPINIEFWQGRPGRLHDRIQYVLEQDGSWQIERLAP
ncbi:MAG: pyridoxamine 5'-phosphate oxidase [Chitinophagaceae bacterium]